MRYFSLLTVLPPDHGGMTRAAMRRSNALRRVGLDSTLLTMDVEPNQARLLEHVRATSELEDLVVLNLYDTLAEYPIEETKSAGSEDLLRLEKGAENLYKRELPFKSSTQSFTFREYIDSNGEIRRVDFVNRNGFTFLIREHPASRRGDLYTALSASGFPSIFRDSIWEVRKSWLKQVFSNEAATLMIDSPPAANGLSQFTLPALHKIFIVHSTMTDPANDALNGEVLEKYRNFAANTRTFDAIVFLSDAQRLDFQERFKSTARLTTIPNAIPLPHREAPATKAGTLEKVSRQRDANLCVILARIVPEKRLADILQAMNHALGENPLLKMEIFGGPLEGAEWLRLKELHRRLGLQTCVSFKGWERDAADRFKDASMTMITSSYEGQGMTIVEAMSRGAIPISYDVNYGPRAVIKNGESGFLVKDGEISELANRMLQISRGGSLIEEVRRRGVRASERYAPLQIARDYQGLFGLIKVETTERRKLAQVRATLTRFSVGISESPRVDVVVKVPEELPLGDLDVSLQMFDLQRARSTCVVNAERRYPEGRRISFEFVLPNNPEGELTENNQSLSLIVRSPTAVASVPLAVSKDISGLLVRSSHNRAHYQGQSK